MLATAAIRDAKDGAEFVREVDRIGFDCEVLSAGAKKRGSPAKACFPASPTPTGSSATSAAAASSWSTSERPERRAAFRCRWACFASGSSDRGERAARNELQAALKESGLRERGKRPDFYMVGGSWRALARIDMFATDYPLPITHEYRIAARRMSAS